MEEFKILYPEFCVLTLSVCLFLGVILYNKLHRSSLCIFFLLSFMELYTPAYYYVVASSKAYLQFGVETLRVYILMSTAAFLSYSVILALFQRVTFKSTHLTVTRWDVPPAAAGCMLLLVLGIAVFLTLYVVYYREGLPLYQAIFHSTWIERPDGSGAIPHWFTVSAFFYIAFPCFYLYYHQKRGFSWVVNLVLIGALSLYMVIGGNKGFVVYWFLFLWVYLWKMKVDGRIVTAGILCVAVLMVIMTGGTDSLSFDGLLAGAKYGMSRFFLTQGAMLVNRIEMIRQGFQFDLSNITLQVFTFAYGKEGGSAPTYYLGDLIVQFGLLGGFLLHLVVYTVIVAAARWMDCQPFSEYKTWLFFTLQYFLGMNSICRTFVIRFALVVALFLLFMVLGDGESSTSCVTLRRPHRVRRFRRTFTEG